MPGSITPLPVLLEEEDRKAYEQLEPPKSIVVRYGYMRMIAELPYDGDAKPGCGSKLVVRTRRGIELGEMLTTTCGNNGCGKSVSRKQMLEYIENSGGKDYPFSTQGKVLRVATIEDLNEQAHLDDGKTEMIRLARTLITELGLKMHLVDVERLLGGERIIFFYTADDWVDFRELVKRLATEYQTRIEMHQVNARDEARIVADYEKCGQHCCCRQFLKVLKPVSMRSAKMQKATLDPTKISGRCGRLMCCLRYEDETYDSLRKNLPHRKSRVKTDDGVGTVIDTQILTQLALVRLDATGGMAAYPVENIEVLTGEAAKLPPQQEGGDSRSSGGDRRSRRSEPRRPKPGKPLAPDEVESREGDAPAPEPDSGAQQAGEDGGGKKKRRRRRRRRKPRGDGEGNAGPAGDGGGQ